MTNLGIRCAENDCKKTKWCITLQRALAQYPETRHKVINLSWLCRQCY